MRDETPASNGFFPLIMFLKECVTSYHNVTHSASKIQGNGEPQKLRDRCLARTLDTTEEEAPGCLEFKRLLTP